MVPIVCFKSTIRSFQINEIRSDSVQLLRLNWCGWYYFWHGNSLRWHGMLQMDCHVFEAVARSKILSMSAHFISNSTEHWQLDQILLLWGLDLSSQNCMDQNHPCFLRSFMLKILFWNPFDFKFFQARNLICIINSTCKVQNMRIDFYTKPNSKFL